MANPPVLHIKSDFGTVVPWVVQWDSEQRCSSGRAIPRNGVLPTAAPPVRAWASRSGGEGAR